MCGRQLGSLQRLAGGQRCSVEFQGTTATFSSLCHASRVQRRGETQSSRLCPSGICRSLPLPTGLIDSSSTHTQAPLASSTIDPSRDWASTGWRLSELEPGLQETRQSAVGRYESCQPRETHRERRPWAQLHSRVAAAGPKAAWPELGCRGSKQRPRLSVSPSPHPRNSGHTAEPLVSGCCCWRPHFEGGGREDRQLPPPQPRTTGSTASPPHHRLSAFLLR